MRKHPLPESELRAGGLDGSNPLGFLAALGLLRVLDEHSHAEGRIRPRLSWRHEGIWYAIIHDAPDVDTTAGIVMADRETWSDDPALLLAYDSGGTELTDPRSDSRAVRDLKPKPVAMRRFHDHVAALAERDPRERIQWFRWRRSMDAAAAYGSELIQDNNGNTKPFALHFTAGQQRFLEAISRIHEGVTADDIREAILGPWRGAATLPTMAWDATMARLYALRATDPSAEKRGGNPGADWLAFNAIPLLLAAPAGSQLRTTGVRGGWKDSDFTWPLWTRPAALTAVRGLLATAALPDMAISARRARGIEIVFASRITRSDQGGYGGFSPARVIA